MKMTIGKRIAVGFSIVILLLGVIAVWSIFGVQNIVGDASEVIMGNKLKGEMTQREVDHLNWAMQLNKLLTDKDVHEFHGGLDPKQCGFGKWFYGEGRKNAEKQLPQLASVFSAMEEPHTELHKSAALIQESYQNADPSRPAFFAKMEAAHYAWVLAVTMAISEGSKKLSVESNSTLCGFGKWFYGEDRIKAETEIPALKPMLSSIEGAHNTLHNSAGSINDALSSGDTKQAAHIFETVSLPAFSETKELLGKMRSVSEQAVSGLVEAQKIYAEQSSKHLVAVQKHLHSVVKTANEAVMTDERMLANASSTKLVNIILGSLAIVVGIILAWVITRSIIGPVTRIIGDLTASGNELKGAASQISEASQSVAAAVNEQASSLEEVTASVEEISSMTKLNSDNAENASQLSIESKNNAQEGETELGKLSEAMSDISDSSKKIEEIINVIDDIAFQTNLLALNAAVEAARAGEHGKGFAVVAEAVRNLAQRSSVAAKDINDLIKDSVVKVEGGRQIAKRSSEVLSSILDSASKVSDINGEISSASSEQTSGLSQIAEAINQLDQMTQNNAASSEETASSSEELSAQADSLHNVVDELAIMVKGKNVKGEFQHIEDAHRLPRTGEAPVIQLSKKARNLDKASGF